MKEKKFLLLCIFFVAIIVNMYNIEVMAEPIYTEGDFYFELEDESIIIVGYYGTDTEITLPDKVAGYPVSKIASGAFTNTTVKIINLPDTIMDIEENAFPYGTTVNYDSQYIPSDESKISYDSTKNNNEISQEDDLNKKGQVDEVEINIEDNQPTSEEYIDEKKEYTTRDRNSETIISDKSQRFSQVIEKDSDIDTSGNNKKKYNKINYIVWVVIIISIIIICVILRKSRKV